MTTIQISLSDHGFKFFTGTPDEVSAEISRLQGLDANALGYEQGDDDSVDVEYQISVADSMDDASDDDYAAAEDICARMGGSIRFTANF